MNFGLCDFFERSECYGLVGFKFSSLNTSKRYLGGQVMLSSTSKNKTKTKFKFGLAKANVIMMPSQKEPK